jgi:ubiquinone/menaquinone biosynthesis C-methylase UbiE
MGIYRNRVLPRLQDKVMDRSDTREIRARVCADLSGEVVEIGFGTGLNVVHYPADVTHIAAVEPSALCVRLARPRIADSPTPVSFVGLSGEALALPSEAYDAAVSTWTLCTIPDVKAALAEVRRVLRPGGRFHFVEHGHAPDDDVFRWQRRIEPVWKRVAGGCHVSRPIAELIEHAGLRLDSLNTYYQDDEPRVFGYTFEGVATKD